VSQFRLNLKLHCKQREVFFDPHLFKVLVCGRGWGKSVLQISEMIRDAIAFPQLMPDYKIDPISPPVVLGGMPTLVQAKPILWRPLVNLLQDCPLVEQINKSEHWIAFKGNRPMIRIIGLNDKDGDGARGLKIYKFAGDEMQDVKKGIFDTIIEPAMSRMPGSRATITGTPKGRLNPLYDYFERPKDSPDWKSFHYYTADNPFISAERIEKARLTMSPRLFEQEYLASFLNFEGQIYSEFDRDLNVTDKLPDRFDCTWLSHDPGDINPGVAVIGEAEGKYYILDCWKGGDGVNAVPYEVVQKRVMDMCDRYNCHRVFVDPARPEVALTFRTLGKKHNIPGLTRTVAANNRVEEGLNIVNNLFYQRKLLVASHLKELQELIQSYHRDKDRWGNIVEKEAPGQDTHILDCTRYILATLKSSRLAGLV
jgi:hypothetical protein